MARGETDDIGPVEVYFDYLCPFVYRAAMWLQRVKEEVGPKLNVEWQFFSLEQVNSQQGPNWKLWKQPDDYPSRGLRAFWASEAAQRQGDDAFLRFHYALLKARHEQGHDIADVNTLVEVAEGAGLEMPRFHKDLSDRSLLSRLEQEHTFAAETLGVFGTPTLVFAGEQAIFLKMAELPPQEECLSLFTDLRYLAERRQYIWEIKRPQSQ